MAATSLAMSCSPRSSARALRPKRDRDGTVTKLNPKRSPYGRSCYGDCAAAWPPLEAVGEVVAGRGVRQRLIGTTERSDGAIQVTYRGKPLYGYVNDPRGKVYCHDVVEFGGTWYAVRKSGRPAP